MNKAQLSKLQTEPYCSKIEKIKLKKYVIMQQANNLSKTNVVDVYQKEDA